jgi:hypothetical protein
MPHEKKKSAVVPQANVQLLIRENSWLFVVNFQFVPRRNQSAMFMGFSSEIEPLEILIKYEPESRFVGTVQR